MNFTSGSLIWVLSQNSSFTGINYVKKFFSSETVDTLPRLNLRPSGHSTTISSLGTVLKHDLSTVPVTVIHPPKLSIRLIFVFPVSSFSSNSLFYWTQNSRIFYQNLYPSTLQIFLNLVPYISLDLY